MSVLMKDRHGFKDRQRIALTLICLTIATTIVVSVSIYVDSASVSEWSRQIDIGPVSMMVAGNGIKDDIDAISEILGVTNVSGLDSAHGEISRTNVIYGFETSGNIYTLTDDYMEKFPTTFTLKTGRWPQNESEIAIPQTLADQAFIGIGWHVNYSFGLGFPETLLTIVGTYMQTTGDLYSHYFYSSIGVVVDSLLNVNTTATRAYLSVDTTSITPFDADGSLSYLANIQEEIRLLYPGYPEELLFSGYTVFDYLSTGIEAYLNWRNTARSSQIGRASGIVLIVVLIDILAIQYNLRCKKPELDYLRARGASSTKIEIEAVKEIFFITLFSAVLGIFFAVLTSRLALMAVGYLQFDFSQIMILPVLITRDTILLCVIVSIIIPALVYLGIKTAVSSRGVISDEKGRMGKISKLLKIIRWDLGVIILSLILMFAFYTTSALIQRNPVFNLILPYLPVPIYLAVSSLVMKGLEKSTNYFSSATKRVLGKIPASIGIRRIGKSAKSAGPVIMILVLAITLSWNNVIADVSLPETREVHAKFALGGDIVFHIKKDESPRWTEFMENITDRPEVIDATIVSLTRLFLSAGFVGAADFVGITPDEYRHIGYDYLGNRLNESIYNDLLLEMIENPKAAIMTRDIAEQYEISAGDTFRAFRTQSDTNYYTFTVIAVVDSLPQPMIPESTFIPSGEGYNVGAHKIFVNRLYLGEKIDLVRDTYSYISVSTFDDVNSTETAINLLETGGDIVTYAGDWAVVDNEVDSYLSSTAYKMDRSVDSMLSITSVILLLGVLSVYTTESIKTRKRDVALLRAMGSETRLITKIEIAELSFLLLFSLGLLGLYAPLFVANSLIASLNVYASWSFRFPVQVFPVIPWFTLILLLSIFVLAIMAFIAVVAIKSSRVELNEALSNTWAKAGPIMESEIQ
ncbi:MAG: hypothetical protein JW779_02780 [Candidatus Thorarchaeota archaeon]|nr:hypothetical protein [Candidatus Thorarchaeota archaeon]